MPDRTDGAADSEHTLPARLRLLDQLLDDQARGVQPYHPADPDDQRQAKQKAQLTEVLRLIADALHEASTTKAKKR